MIRELIEVLSERPQYDYEIVAVDDGSPDELGSVLAAIAAENQRVKVIRFTRNFGKHSAVIAGYRFTRGSIIVDLDDDLQSPTPSLWRLIEPIECGSADFVTARYLKRQKSVAKKLGSLINHWVSIVVLGKRDNVRFENFSAMSSSVRDEIVKYSNVFPYLEGLVLRVTDRICVVEMEQRARGDGRPSGFTFFKSFALFLNGLTGFSVRPLRLASILGLILSGLGFSFGLWVVYKRLVDETIQSGFSAVMATMLFLGGSILLTLGIIGEYVGRIYITLNSPPQYVIRSMVNVDRETWKQA